MPLCPFLKYILIFHLECRGFNVQYIQQLGVCALMVLCVQQ